jgi:hypothetical protein
MADPLQGIEKFRQEFHSEDVTTFLQDGEQVFASGFFGLYQFELLKCTS